MVYSFLDELLSADVVSYEDMVTVDVLDCLFGDVFGFGDGVGDTYDSK